MRKISREMLCLRLFCCATIVWLWKHKGGDVGNFISQIVLQCFARLDGEGKHVSIILTANIPEIVLQATLPNSRACVNVWFPHSPSWTPLLREKLEELLSVQKNDIFSAYLCCGGLHFNLQFSSWCIGIGIGIGVPCTYRHWAFCNLYLYVRLLRRWKSGDSGCKQWPADPRRANHSLALLQFLLPVGDNAMHSNNAPAFEMQQ